MTKLLKLRLQRCLRTASGIFCAAAILAAGLPQAAALAAVTAKTTDYLNLRQGAGTNTGVLLTLGKNASVTVLDNSSPQWAKVQTSSGKVGYCSKQYLVISGATSASSGTSSGSATTGAGSSSSGTAASAVTTDNLNLRSSASLTAGILTILKKGTTVSVVDNSNADWAKVKTASGQQGWCSKIYLSISAAATAPTAPTAPATGGATVQTTDYLNLREGAGTNYKVILTLTKGASVTVLDNTNAQWVKVQTSSGKQGWCSRDYVALSGKAYPVSKPASSAPAASSSASSTSSAASSSQPSGSSSSQPSSSPSSGSGDPSAGNPSNPDGPAVVSATVTADVLRLRESPSTDAQVLANLVNGTSLAVLDASNSDWIKVQTADGKTGFVSAEFVKLIYADGSTSPTTGGDSGTPAAALSLSASSQSVPSGKTLYLKATTNPDGASVTWTSSNASVAKVSNGYVTALAKGSAVITATSGSHQATCTVTVTDAEPVRTAYASPNVVGPNEAVTLTAVTDAARDSVEFVVTFPGGATQTVLATSSTQETTSGVVTKKWTGTISFPAAGTYAVTALSSVNGTYSTTGFTTNAFVATQSDYTVSTSEERRASDKMINLIAQWEGYRASVYADTLASSQVPTIGYGCTLSVNAVFYDNISQTEAWSLMVNKINVSSYTTELNKMIQNNHFLMSQNQADALISFAYNVGAGYFNSSNEMDFIKIMKNAVVPPQFSAGITFGGTVTLDTVMRNNSGMLSAAVATVPAGTRVTVTGGNFANTRDGWYQVQLQDGSTGWINSGDLGLDNADALVHDLNYTNAYAFGTELIRWNLAGGKFYTGLFYRRLGEADVYNYNDYSAPRTNKYGYGYPSVAASLS